MRRKFFSTLLMGLLVFGAMGTVTSCKDYDDDISANTGSIKNLQTQMTTLESALKQVKEDAQKAAATYATKQDLKSLQDQIKNLVTAEKLQEAINDLQKVIDGKADKSELEALKTKIDGIDGRLNKLGTTLNEAETAQKAVNENLQNQIDALKAFENELGGKKGAEELKGQVAKLQEDLKALQAASGNAQAIKELKETMEKANKEVEKTVKNINILTVFVKRNLSSLVLKPDTYYGGIEAIKVLSDSAAIYEEGDASLTFFKLTGEAKILSGIGTAMYHVNPSTVDLSNSTIGFYGNVAELLKPMTGLETRAGADIATPVYDKADDLFKADKDAYKDGILSIPFKANFKAIEANLKAGNGSFVAAQISKGDTTVTSDYALIAPVKIYNLLVADNSFAQTPFVDNIVTPASGHLHKKFSDLKVENIPATHNVKYNESINISALLETHYTTEKDLATDSANVNIDAAKVRKMDPATFKALGLKYVVKTVDYTLGSNQTSETHHIQLSTDKNGDVIATPRNVSNTGETIKDKEANASAVGRMPMLVIEIQDAKGTILAYGYMKLLITDLDAVGPQDVTSDPFAMNDYFFDCNGAKDRLTWAQVEFHIYNDLLKISKKNFDETYKFVAGKQFVPKKDGGYKEATADEMLGTVTEIRNDGTGALTHVLEWAFAAADYKNVMKAADSKEGVSTKDVTVYVKYENQKNGGDVYVPMTIKAGKLHFATANLNATKTLAQWYKYQSSVNAPKAADAFEVRANVPVPTEADNKLENTEFVKDLHDYFLNGKLSASLNNAEKFPELKAEMADPANQPKFKFTLPKKGVNADFSANAANQWTVKGYSGNEYTLALSDDNLTIKIVKVKKVGAKDPVDIDKKLVGMDAAGKVTYVEGEESDDILNFASHSKLGSKQTFTAYVQITLPELCYEPYMPQTFFNVRFLRPLNLSGAEPYEIKDAPNDWQKISFGKLVSVTDWRDYTGLADNTNLGKNDGKKQFDFKYYGIEFIADVENALTDANLGTAARDSYKNDVAYRKQCVNAKKNITNLQLVQDGDFVKYMNNGGNTGTYHIFLPIKMKYVFGNYDASQQKAWAVITVKNTAGNAKKINF
ncbi:hypothetical protein [Hallella colorans]|jgi:hypothetical protein|uniref:hypothetical protein n=1 Tax=Hallella colorans TaxID=1703337 RepID=UPI0023F050B2|nr:hypothetical protein [Hallella colorans]